jgi:uncharacterized membrane protein HdeD (DUF308 family)
MMSMERIVLSSTSSRSSEGTMESFGVRRWKTLAFVGLTSLVLGVSLLHWPTITFVAVALLFAGYTIVDEFLVLAAATRTAALEETRR